MINYICIEGNIGSGKTSLAKKLSQHLKSEFIGEEFEENPFLPLFYQNPEKYSFALEFSFLLDRARQLISKKENLKITPHVSDYHIEKCLYFAKINLGPEKFSEFEKSFPSVAGLIPPPDLLITLHLPVEKLQQNIRNRGRAYEQNLSSDYLNNINQIYLQKSEMVRDFRTLNFHLKNPAAETYERIFTEICSYLKQPPSPTSVSIKLD